MRSPSRPITVTFLPANVAVSAHKGDTLLDAALGNGIDMPHECGGNCSCTTCHVTIEAGLENLSPMEEPEDERLGTAPDRTARSRLACQALLQGGDVVATLRTPE